MKNVMLGCLATLFGLALAPAVQAQYYRPITNPYNRPAISPYLNLARPGSAGVNYYGLVRPQLDTYAALGQLQQQELALRAGASGLDPNSPFLMTGHATRFGNYSHYFFSQG